ncbi:hypothetical protein M514_04617 [Trichuris suis]|uniref:Uncharacterized protein n=1 Tax=Trichuris suis TaxID=68888 RepID=A0A085NV38_9BILA|nr:hypothetical protein M513_04617 [Trichuris suis]KFD73334.1 hypothetical protein M514_04617 [Trichuris suis]
MAAASLGALMLVSLFRFYNVDGLPASIPNWEQRDKQVHWPTYVNWYPTEAAAETQANSEPSQWPLQNGNVMQQVKVADTYEALPLPFQGKNFRRLRNLKKMARRGIGWQPLKRDVLKQLTFLDQLNNEKNREIPQSQLTEDAYNTKNAVLSSDPSIYPSERLHGK